MSLNKSLMAFGKTTLTARKETTAVLVNCGIHGTVDAMIQSLVHSLTMIMDVTKCQFL